MLKSGGLCSDSRPGALPHDRHLVRLGVRQITRVVNEALHDVRAALQLLVVIGHSHRG